jgi:Zn-dependent peptidase ImmA (M78 family)
MAGEDQPLWGSPEFEWTWVELLEWLANSWLALTLDDGLPFPVSPTNAYDLTRYVNAAVDDSSGSLADERETRLWEFRETHDFARALPGTMPPSFIVWREGLLGHVLTAENHWSGFEWDVLQGFLTEIGESIASRLEGSTDERSVLALDFWHSREQADDTEVIEQATGIVADESPILLAAWRRRKTQGTLADVVARSEILAAARMTSDLPQTTVNTILEELVSARNGSMSLVDDLVGRVLPTARQLDAYKPYEQGHMVAQLVRLALELQPKDKFDTDHWMSKLSIEYREVSLAVEGIDAIAAWGDEHGPVIIINRDGKHSNATAGRNASVAHEIGHLIFDRHAALPAAEVLGGLGNPLIEQRARAFAAELLLPNVVARNAFDLPRTQDEILEAASDLAHQYDVSRELVAWQAHNSANPLREISRRTLSTLVSKPWQY